MLGCSEDSCPQRLSLTILTYNVLFPFSISTTLISPLSPCIFCKLQNPPSGHTLFLPQSDFSWLEISWTQADSLSINISCYHLCVVDLLVRFFLKSLFRKKRHSFTLILKFLYKFSQIYIYFIHPLLCPNFYLPFSVFFFL